MENDNSLVVRWIVFFVLIVIVAQVESMFRMVI